MSHVTWHDVTCGRRHPVGKDDGAGSSPHSETGLSGKYFGSGDAVILVTRIDAGGRVCGRVVDVDGVCAWTSKGRKAVPGALCPV